MYNAQDHAQGQDSPKTLRTNLCAEQVGAINGHLGRALRRLVGSALALGLRLLLRRTATNLMPGVNKPV